MSASPPPRPLSAPLDSRKQEWAGNAGALSVWAQLLLPEPPRLSGHLGCLGSWNKTPQMGWF